MCPLISYIEMSVLDVKGSGEGCIGVLNVLDLYTKFLGALEKQSDDNTTFHDS